MALQLIEGTKGKRHRLVSIVNNMQSAESLKMQSVMLGGAADPSAFMTEVGPFPYEAFRAQEGLSPGRRLSRELLPQLSLPQVNMLTVQCQMTQWHADRIMPKDSTACKLFITHYTAFTLHILTNPGQCDCSLSFMHLRCPSVFLLSLHKTLLRSVVTLSLSSSGRH